ncbi:MAG: TolC family protein [Alphaproteobacteria bacterium]|nr:TolC family protein [Alphaproteobacteria bacterium]
MNKKFGFLMCLALPVYLAGVPAYAGTLQDAVRTAVQNHPSVTAADAGYMASLRQAQEERSAYFPELSASGTAGRIYEDNATSRGLETTRGAAYSGFGEASLTMRQVIFDGMETSNRVAAANSEAKSMKSSLEETQEQIAMRASQAYIEVLRTRAAVNLILAEKKKIAEYQSRIKAMFDQGGADESELQQARDVSMIIESSLAEYQGQKEVAEAAYLEATGMMPDNEMVVPETLSAVIPETAEDAFDAAMSNHAGLRSAQQEADAADKGVNIARAAYFPDFTGELSYLKSDKKDVIGGELEDRRAVVRMNWNFSTGGEQKAEVSRQKHLYREALAKTDEMKRAIKRDIYQAYAQYRAVIKKAGLSKERVDLNKKLYKAYERQFEGSRINLLQLMRANSQLFNAQLEENDNKYTLLSVQYQVLASIGYLKSALDAAEIVKAEGAAPLAEIETAAGSAEGQSAAGE